jgi:hypothetical protein
LDTPLRDLVARLPIFRHHPMAPFTPGLRAVQRTHTEEHSRLSWLLLPVLLFLVPPMIQYRQELGPFSIAFLEVPLLIASTIFIIHQLLRYRRLTLSTNPVVLIFVAFTVLSMVVRPWSMVGIDGLAGISDIRNWVIPTLGMIAMLGALQTQWRKVTVALLFVAFGVALIGIWQFATHSVPPFLQSEALAPRPTLVLNRTGDALGQTNFGAAFFAHPGGLAQYLSPILMVAWGWLLVDLMLLANPN